MIRMLLGGMVAATALSLALAHAQPSGKEVKITATAGKPDANGQQVVNITVNIARPWYAYANPVGNEDFASNATKVVITGKNKLEAVDITYPQGKLKKDKVIGEYKIYEDKAEIKATVRRAKGDDGPLAISVTYAICNAESGMCLLPETVKLTVP